MCFKGAQAAKLITFCFVKKKKRARLGFWSENCENIFIYLQGENGLHKSQWLQVYNTAHGHFTSSS